MTPKTRRRWSNTLRASQWVLIGGILWALIDGVFLRESPSVSVAEAGAPDVSEDAHQGERVSLSDLEPMWRRDLQQPLHNPPPPPTKAKPRPPAPKPPPRLPKLLATFVEDGRSWGLFETFQGKARVLPQGGVVEEFIIVRLTGGTALLEHGGKRYEISIPRTEQVRPTRQPRRR